MLDKKNETVLSMLRDKAPNGYHVLNKTELLDSLPKRSNIDERALSDIIAYLKTNGFVDVKYQDKDDVCLCVLTKTDNYFRTERNHVEKTKITNGQIWFLFGGMFLASFLGAFFAILLGKLL